MMPAHKFFRLVTIITAIGLGLLSLGNSYAATTGKIVGVVTDSRSGDALPGVNVVVVGTQMGGATDLEGRFFIINVPPGIYSVRASMMGYTVLTKTGIRVRIDQTSTIDFVLEETTLQGREVTIVAERPVVELDLTASKEVMSAADFQTSWVANVKEALNTQSGVNLFGGVRGGFQLDVNYIVDGQVVRDAGSNQSLAPINTSAIQEMELLTGGWNAEYPQANSGIVNIVTKSGRDRYFGTVRYRMRPPGIYHWGRNIYSKDNYEWWETKADGSPGLNSLAYWTTNKGGHALYTAMTPEQRLTRWRQIISSEPTLTDYDKRTEWDLEGSLGGPLFKGVGFFASARWTEEVPIYPSGLKYNPSYNAQLKFDYNLTRSTRLLLTGMHYHVTNTGAAKTAYGSSEDVAGKQGNPEGYFYSPYDPAKFAPWGGFGYGGGETLGRVSAPEKYWQYNWQLKATHTFNPRSFMEVAFEHQQFRRYNAFDEFWDKGYYTFRPSWGEPVGNAQIMNNGLFVNFGQYNDGFYDNTWARENKISADFVSQVTPHHQIKTGAEFAFQYFKRISGSSHGGTARTNDVLDPKFYPWEAAAYFQDKIEVQGMIVNAGVRLDLFNLNKKVSPNIFDPMGMFTDGYKVGEIAFDYEDPAAVKTKTQYAISPRIGISHPISSTTVLHFMYGHFNQRPGYFKMAQYGSVEQQGKPKTTTHSYSSGDRIEPRDGVPVTWYTAFANPGNPALTYEKYIQYEVGFEQNIAKLLRLDVTMYYKDGRNLTSLGYTRGRAINSVGLTGGIMTSMRADPPNAAKNVGNFNLPINGGWANVRGLELNLQSQFSNLVQFQAIYNLSYALTDRYGASILYQDWGVKGKNGIDRFYGGSNSDKGNAGNRNEMWNPNNTVRVVATLSSPAQFGPSFGGFYLLGDWFLNVFWQYTSGQKYTYHSALKGDFSTEPNNMTWDPRYVTNLRFAKTVPLFSTLRSIWSVEVRNVFNNKQLRLLSGQNLVDYEEYGTLPKVAISGEDDVWSWYYPNLTPRQIYFGVTLEF